MTAVSFLVPVHGEAPWLQEVLAAIEAQTDEEILVVDDGVRGEAAELLSRWADRDGHRVLPGPGRGAAAAINVGVRAARHPWIAQIDQDVVILPGWRSELSGVLTDPEVGAAQGYWVTDRSSSLWARVAGLDLERRHRPLLRSETDHVCTGNTLYRAESLSRVGLFDETLGYGYDNDMSYRLRHAGFRLVIHRRAESLHRWPESWRGYLRQQYGLGYGRLDLIARHPRRLTGDRVSGLRMILHVPGLLASLASAGIGTGIVLFGGRGGPAFGIAALLLAAIVIDRLAASFSAWRHLRDPAAWFFVPAHLLRDTAWVAALLSWSGRRLLGRSSLPAHSMKRSR